MLPAAEEERFVVHEWGVFIRNATTSGSCLETANELLTDLPDFVKTYRAPEAQVRVWKKPVLHFYGREGLPIDVVVRTAKGFPTVYWPDAQVVQNGTGFDLRWKGTLTDKEPGTFPSTRNNWWKIARNVPSKYVRTDGGSERFIFYEATALQEPTVTATIDEDAVKIYNSDSSESGPVVVIVNDGDTRRWTYVEKIGSKETVSVRKDAFKGDDASGAALLDACRRQWQAYGMTKEEAAAIVDVWKTDLLQTKGFLMTSRMPETFYRAMFPLSITPEPAETVRAGVVFDTLSGEEARLKWIPKLESTIAKVCGDLKDDEFAVREKAQTELKRFGDLAKACLTRTSNSDDAEARSSANRLLERLKPRAPKSPPQPQIPYDEGL
jgi:hypothetical protein